MKSFYFAILFAIAVVLFSCSNAPVQTEAGMMLTPPKKDISSEEVEFFCRDMTYEESIDCIASLKDKKQEEWKKWQDEHKN